MGNSLFANLLKKRTKISIKQKVILLFIFELLTPINAELISGTAYLACDSNISFSPLLFSTNPKIENKENGGYVYSCAAKLNNLFDLFVATEFRNYTCAFTCRNIAIGSPRPFYISLDYFAPATFSFPLLLNDADHFVRCDTVRIDCHSPGKKVSDSTCDSTHCYLPHIGTVRPERQPSFGSFLVIKNSYDQWVCVTLNSVMRKDEYDSNRYYIAGYRMNWYLQTDHTLDFTALTVVNNQKKQQYFFKNIPKWKTSRIYTISGKQVTGMQKSSPTSYSGVLLIETDNGIQRVLSYCN